MIMSGRAPEGEPSGCRFTFQPAASRIFPRADAACSARGPDREGSLRSLIGRVPQLKWTQLSTSTMIIRLHMAVVTTVAMLISQWGERKTCQPMDGLAPVNRVRASGIPRQRDANVPR